MICNFCGKEIGDGERICKYCGTVLPPNSGPAEQAEPVEAREKGGMPISDRRPYYSENENPGLGETQIFRRPETPSGFENSRQVRDEVSRRHQHSAPVKRQYYRYNPEEEAKHAQRSKAGKNPVYKQRKAKPVRKNRHIGRTIAGLVFKAALGFVIGFLLYILVINIGGWVSEAFESIGIPFLNNLLN